MAIAKPRAPPPPPHQNPGSATAAITAEITISNHKKLPVANYYLYQDTEIGVRFSGVTYVCTFKSTAINIPVETEFELTTVFSPPLFDHPPFLLKIELKHPN